MKKFKLSPEHASNIKGREKAIDYLLDLIKRDINMYLYVDVLPTLGLKDEKIELSADREWLKVIEEKSKIVT